MILHKEEREKFLQHWIDFCESKISPEDTIGLLSHHLRAALLHKHAHPPMWRLGGLHLTTTVKMRYELTADDFHFMECITSLSPLSAWSSEKDLPHKAFKGIPFSVRKYLNIEDTDLLNVRSFGKTVEWHLKNYQAFVDRIEATVEFYRLPHTYKTPRTLMTTKNSKSPEKYLFMYADIGEIILSIFKARIHFLKTHAEDIDPLLKSGYIFSDEVLSLPSFHPHQKWHDLRPVQYYFIHDADDLEADKDKAKALLVALPHLFDSKQAHGQRKLPLIPETTHLKKMLETYHDFNKKDEAALNERINHLNQISREAASLSEGGAGKYAFTPQELKLLQELETNSRNKSEYLRQLKSALEAEHRRLHLIPLDEQSTTSLELRSSHRRWEIYNDLDPEGRALPYQYEYSKLCAKSPFIDPDIKLQKVAPFLEIQEDQFKIEEENEYYHTALGEQVHQLFDKMFPEPVKDKKKTSYFLWLENKNTLDTSLDLSRSAPQSDMLVEVKEGKAFNKVFAQQDQAIIEDGVYLYVIPEDGKLYVFPGERSTLATKEDNSKIHEIDHTKYGVNFSDFTTRTLHPMLCKGANVFSAGEVKFKNGQINHINNDSGHYVPFEYHLLNGLHRLLPCYQELFSTDTTVGRNGIKDPIAYKNFMALNLETLKQVFIQQSKGSYPENKTMVS